MGKKTLLVALALFALIQCVQAKPLGSDGIGPFSMVSAGEPEAAQDLAEKNLTDEQAPTEAPAQIIGEPPVATKAATTTTRPQKKNKIKKQRPTTTVGPEVPKQKAESEVAPTGGTSYLVPLMAVALIVVGGAFFAGKMSGGKKE